MSTKGWRDYLTNYTAPNKGNVNPYYENEEIERQREIERQNMEAARQYEQYREEMAQRQRESFNRQGLAQAQGLAPATTDRFGNTPNYAALDKLAQNSPQAKYAQLSSDVKDQLTSIADQTDQISSLKSKERPYRQVMNQYYEDQADKIAAGVDAQSEIIKNQNGLDNDTYNKYLNFARSNRAETNKTDSEFQTTVAPFANGKTPDDVLTMQNLKNLDKIRNSGGTLTPQQTVYYASNMIKNLSPEAQEDLQAWADAQNKDSTIDYDVKPWISFNGKKGLMGTSGSVTGQGLQESMAARDKFMQDTGMDEDVAKTYFDYANIVRNNKNVAHMYSNIANDVKTGGALTKAGYTAQSLITQPIRGTIGLANEISEPFLSKQKGFGSDVNADRFAGANFTNAVIGTVSNDLENRYGSLAANAYNLGNSIGESTINMLAGGLVGGSIAEGLGVSGEAANKVLNAVSLPVFQGAAFDATYADARNRGLNENAAYALSVATALTEAGTEIFSMDKLWDMAKHQGKAATRSALMNWLVSSGIEGTEEVAGNIIEDYADRLIAGDKSNYQANVNNYIAQGMSKEAANQAATQDFLKDTAMSFVGGAVSGAVMGAAADTVGRVRTNQYGKMTRSAYEALAEENAQKVQSIDTTTEEGKAQAEQAQRYAENPYQQAVDNMDDTTPEGKAAKADAQKIADKVDAGKTLSDHDIGKLNELVNESYDAAEEAAPKHKTAQNKQSTTQESKINVDEAVSQLKEAAQNKDVDTLMETYRELEKTGTPEEVAQIRNEFRSIRENLVKHGVDSYAIYEAYKKVIDSENTRNKTRTEDIQTVPSEYRNEVSHYTAQEGRNAMAEALRNDSVEELNDAYNAMKNSTDAQAKQDAEDAYFQYGMLFMNNGHSKAEINSDSLSKEEAYTAGLKGEDIGNVSDRVKLAYNAGKQAAIENRTNANKGFDSAAEIASRATRLGGSSKGSAVVQEAYKNNYSQGTPARLYDNVAKAAINAGRTGTQFDSLLNDSSISGDIAVVGETTARDLFKAGAMVREMDLKQDALRADKQKSETKKFGSGTFNDLRFDATNDETHNFLEAFANAMGIDIDLVAEEKGVNASYSAKEGKITVNANANNSIKSLLHEVGEFADVWNHDEFRNVTDAINTTLEDMMGARKYAEYRQAYIDAYAVENGKTDTDIDKEIACNNIYTLIGSEEGMNKLLKAIDESNKPAQAVTIKQKLADWIGKVIDAFKKLADKYSDQSDWDSQHVGNILEDMTSLQEKLIDSIAKATSNNKEAAQALADLHSEEYGAATLGDVRNALELAPDVKKIGDSDESIETTKDLIAVHNTDAKALLSNLSMGGFPCPSIAVIRYGMSHTKFGEYSAIFKRSTIDPLLSVYNKVFGGDAWTPTFPKIEYNLNEKVIDAAKEKIDKAINSDMKDALLRGLGTGLDSVNATQRINNAGGHVAEAFKNNTAIQYAFLKENGVEINPDYEEKRMLSSYSNDVLKNFIKLLPEGEKSLEEMGSSRYFNAHPEFQDAIKKIILDNANSELSGKPSALAARLAQRRVDAFGFNKFDQLVRGAREYYANGETIPTVANVNSVHDLIESNMKGREKEFDHWIENDLLKDVITEKGIRNSKDYYTPSGKPRSWAGLHESVTLENIVKVMKDQPTKGGSGIFATDTALFSIATRNFKSIEDMKAYKNQLGQVDEEIHSAEYGEMRKQLAEIASKIQPKSDSFLAYDGALQAIAEAYEKHPTNAKAIERYLTKNYQNIYEGVGKDIIDLAEKSRDMMRNYFEAKPMRAVYNSEIAAIIAPNNMPAELRQFLADNNIKAIEYAAGNEESRQQALEQAANSDEDIRFSLNLKSDDRNSFDFDSDHDDFFDDFAPDAARILEEGKDLIKDLDISDTAIKDIATDIRREYKSNFDATTFRENVKKVFAYAKQNGINYNDFLRVVQEVARPVIEASTKDVATEERQAFVDSIKGTYKLTEKQKQEIKYQFGNIREFQKRMRGIKISDKANTTLGAAWSEVCDASTVSLDREAVEGNQIGALKEAYDSFESSAQNVYGENQDEAAADLGLKIVEQYYKAAGKKDARAAKLSDQIKEQRIEFEKSLKERYNKRYEEELEKLQERYRAKGQAVKEDELKRIAAMKAKHRDAVSEMKERQAKRAAMDKLNKSVSKLYDYVLKPTDQKHVPKQALNAALNFLDSIDMNQPYIRKTDAGYVLRMYDHQEADGTMIFNTSTYKTKEEALKAYKQGLAEGKGSAAGKKWRDKMNAMKDLYEESVKQSQGRSDKFEDVLEGLDPDLYEKFKKIVDTDGVARVSMLDSEQLETLNNVVKNVTGAINKANKMVSDNATISQTGYEIMNHANNVNGRKAHNAKINPIIDYLTLDNATPETVLHGLGQGGDKLNKIMIDAMNKKTRDVRTTQEYMIGDGSIKNGKFTGGALEGIAVKDLEAWTGDNAKVIDVGHGMKMTTAQIMSLYEMNKRKQMQVHLPGGIVPDDIKIKGKTTQQSRVHLTAMQIDEITNKLTADQKRVADAMQKFMSTECSTWGNEASNKMYNYDKFNDKDYYPISVDKNTLDMRNSDVATGMINSIKNSGFTKQVVQSDKPVVVKDIFDVFTGHVQDMATYHSYAAPISDFIRVINYKDVDGTTEISDYKTVKDAINKIYGRGGMKYIANFVSDLNGREKSSFIDSGFVSTIMGNYKVAAVGGNIRVVVQQPTAYVRASMMINPKYLIEGLGPNANALEMQERTSDISWAKAQGNVDGYIANSMKATITGYKTPVEKVKDATMALAGKADDVTWRALYNAVYLEQADQFRAAGKVAVGEKFEDAVNDRFNSVISRTQVIDATLFRSQMMRSKDTMNKIQSSFMAEPTKTYNMFLRAVMDGMQTAKNGRLTPKASKTIIKTLAVFTANNIANATAQALVDGFRNKKDDDTYGETFIASLEDDFKQNMDVTQLIPIVKDISEMIQNTISNWGKSTYGNTSDRMDTAAISSALDFITKMGKYISSGGTSMTPYGAIRTSAKAFSQLTGIPVYAIMRDSVALYNTMNDAWSGKDIYANLSDQKAHVKAQTLQTVGEGGDYKGAIEEMHDMGSSYNAIVTNLTKEYKDQYLELYKTDKSAAGQMKSRLQAAYNYLDDQLIKEGSKKKRTTRKWLEQPDKYKE